MKNCIPRAHNPRVPGRLLKICLLILWAGTANAESTPSERSLTLSSGADATLTLPATKSSARGMVIMIHGWSGQKDEVGDLFKLKRLLSGTLPRCE
jgi:hypothetical protein